MESKVLIQTGLENVKRSIDKTLESLTFEELKWQPRPYANSIGLILFHIARSGDGLVRSVIQGKPQLWESEKWYQKLGKAIDDGGAHYTEEQVASFMVPDRKDLLDYFEAVYKQTLECVKNLTPDKLDQKVDLSALGPSPKSTPGAQGAPPRRPPFELIVGPILMMNMTHIAEHAGEISYLRGLQRGMNK